MKKVALFLLLLCLAVPSWAADTARFDHMRTALIVRTTQQTPEARYMTQRLMEPFRIPYWDRLQTEDQLSPQDVTGDALRRLSQQYQADIVAVPVVRTWYWRQYTVFFRDDSELMTDCAYRLTVYVYDRSQDSFKSYSASGRERESASILNDPYEILRQGMDQIMNNLPYKRIPTDIENLPGSIPGVQVKTTDGGATLLTTTLPVPM